MKMFEQDVVAADLDARLRDVGIDPGDKTVLAIKTIVSAYYAQRTAEVLTRMREVLDKFSPGELH